MNGKKLSLFLVLVHLIPMTSHSNDYVPIIPDGSTDTKFVVNGDGRMIVDIAPPDSHRVSINKYDRFNVPESGVDVDNAQDAARTIVHDVVGSESSKINGKLEVVGTRAHTIISNKNGINLDGAEFVNTADLIITTGKSSLVERNVSSDVVQNNILITTHDGEVTVGENGLSGDMSTLDFISKKISINGPVVNKSEGLRNVVRIFPGESGSELDTSLSPSNPQRSMATVTQSNKKNNAILVNISKSGSISAGNISVAVTEEGAGFRHSGSMAALSGDFVLSSSGDVVLDGGKIHSARDININSKSVEMNSKKSDQENIRAEMVAQNGSVNINAKNKMHNNGGLIWGNARNANNAKSTGAVNISSDEVLNRSISTDLLAVIFGNEDDVVIEGDRVENNSARLVSNKALLVKAEEYFDNIIDIPDFEGKGEVVDIDKNGKRLWYTLFIKREKISGYEIDYGKERVDNTLSYVVGKEKVEIVAPVVRNSGGEINSDNGDVVIKANYLKNKAEVVGKIESTRVCGLGCGNDGYSTVRLMGGKINAGHDVVANVSKETINESGQIYALNDINIDSQKLTTSAFTVPLVNKRDRAVSSFSRDDVRVYRQDQGGTIISNMGNINIKVLQGVDNIGGSIKTESDSGELIINGDLNVVRLPIEETPVFGNPIGIFNSWLD